MHLVWRRAALGVERQPGEGVIEDAHREWRQRASSESLDDGGSCRQPGHVDAGVAQDAPAKRMEGAHLDGAVWHALWFQGRVETLPQLLCSAAIEGDRAHGRRI